MELFNRFILFVMLILPWAGFAQTDDHPGFNPIYDQVVKKNFFKAGELFSQNKKNLSEEYQYFFGAVLDNAFNKPESSNQKILKLATLKTALPDSLMFKIYRIKEDNCVKLYDYSGAKNAVENTLKKYGKTLPEDEKKDLQNNLKIWSALENEPKQKVIINADTRLKMVKDAANLKNLQIKSGDDEMNFIFDTGANISTVSRSVAQRLKMKIIPADIDVQAVTGATVKADLALCKKMSLGNIVIENAVFLVFEDAALSFPQIKYQINGILGFPVIEALKEVQITRDDYFFVPRHETKISLPSNLAINGLSPLIYIDGKHFTFDTGATQTILYSTFYTENKAELEKQYQPVSIMMGGAGGTAEHEGFKIDHTFHILGKSISLKGISVLKKSIHDQTVYGNIGQDVIRQFGKMTLNFDRMFIKFD
ncbi:aspartyl protease family protein [Chryseobacterium tongliaoense]|uniref:aspartyl protease family protein n=1 Tax=Chryseobacterium tongliaoense TaxID=3240933 RepID=UPI00351776BF